jgi:DnaJ domain
VSIKNHYATLGLPPDCPQEAIKAAYRQLVLMHHPDQNPADKAAVERFLEIKEAYDILSDPAARAAYDHEFVRAFPGYELEGEEEEPYWKVNPPASMPVVRDEGSNPIVRILMVMVLPIITGGLAMNFTGEAAWALIGAVAGLLAAIWLGTLLGDD